MVSIVGLILNPIVVTSAVLSISIIVITSGIESIIIVSVAMPQLLFRHSWHYCCPCN